MGSPLRRQSERFMRQGSFCILAFSLLPLCGCAETWLKPTNAQGYYSRGVAYGRQGDFDKQIADFTQDTKLDPRNPQAYYNRGVVYQQREDIDHAIADFTETIRLDPAAVDAYYYRGLAYAKKAGYDKTNADADWSVAFARSDNCDAAIADFSAVVRLAPNFANAYYARGAAYQRKGDETSAQNDFEQARRLGYRTR
jgi:tetratricopeptide (TPR) repeat protein